MSFDIKAGSILISEPFLPDPNFSRSVVLLTEHNIHGSFGFVLNQPTEHSVNRVMEELVHVNHSLYQGGPVELESFHYLHTYGHIDKSLEIGDGVHWSGDFEQVYSGIQDGSLSADQFRFFIGYSGWAAGQLEAELAEKSWIIGDFNAKYLFDDTIEDAELWKHAIRDKGGNFSLLANSPENPSLN